MASALERQARDRCGMCVPSFDRSRRLVGPLVCCEDGPAGVAQCNLPVGESDGKTHVQRASVCLRTNATAAPPPRPVPRARRQIMETNQIDVLAAAMSRDSEQVINACKS